jgi:Zn-dependent peptidase ImmA (M78 family)
VIPVHEAELKAREARNRYGLTLQTAVPDILRVVEQDAHVHVAVIRIEGDEFAGAYKRNRGTGFILVNGAHSPVRQRFTLAHELGHHELDHRAALDRQIVWNTRDQREVAANWFAAEFLAPRQAVRRWFEERADRPQQDMLVDLVLLANHFGVSCLVALYRAHAAGVFRSSRQKAELEERIKAQQHSAIRGRLYLRPFRDSLSELQRTWRAPVRMPQQTIDDILGAVVDGVLDRKTAAARLMVPERQLANLLADRDVAE